MANDYKITRSNYTLKKRHQNISGGVVYERDFMTTTNLGGWDSGSIPYGEGNFKMYYRLAANAKKRPYRGSWLQNTCSSATSDYWTAQCVGNSGAAEEKLIKIKPNVNSLLDFVYYGSCTELIKSTITDIVKKFPAELYFEEGARYGLEGDIVRNPYDIDLKNDIVPEGENPLRYLYKNFNRYYIINTGGDKLPIVDAVLTPNGDQGLLCGNYTLQLIWNTASSAESCVTIISTRYADGSIVLSAPEGRRGWRIRPNDDEIKKFFDELDDFAKILLNKQSTPIYTAIFDTPFETERGVSTYQRTYTWPVENGWNLAIEGPDYKNYVDSLLNLADFYDEYYSDNLWRMLTHDSIKAMDITFSNPEKDEDSDDYNVGTSRLEGLFWAIGRQFDEIKRCIGNIKSASNVSYDGNNNVPDYFMSDVLGLTGWEVYNIDTTLSADTVTEPLFSGVTTGYKPVDANSLFLSNLKLNSKAILGKKGTRSGIESLLGLFGLISRDRSRMLSASDFDYDIHEYIGVVTNAVSAQTYEDKPLPLEEANSLKLNRETDTPENETIDTLDGLPAKVKYVEVQNGGIVRVLKYIVPWYDKSKLYDGGLYYQSKGGWGYHEMKIHNQPVSGYDETVKYIILVDRVVDLKNIPNTRLYDGVIAYVAELSDDDLKPYYHSTTDFSNFSNYFYLQFSKYYYSIHDANGYGWENVPKTAIEGDNPTEIGKQIAYIEQIVEDYKANNPHVGFGDYDNGETYINYLRNPLKYCIDEELIGEKMFQNEAYDCDGALKFSGNTFEINALVEDNSKAWYFEPISENGKICRLTKTSNFEYTCGADGENHFSIGSGETDTTFTSSAFTYDFVSKEQGNDVNEVAADSIVNTKVVEITFYCEPMFAQQFNKYLRACILPYLRQILPSTVIFKYSVVLKNTSVATTLDTTGGVSLTDVNGVAADNQTNSDDDIIVNLRENSLING